MVNMTSVKNINTIAYTMRRIIHTDWIISLIHNLVKMALHRWQRVKTSHKQNVQETQKLFLNKLAIECLLLLFLPFWYTLHSNFATSR